MKSLKYQNEIIYFLTGQLNDQEIEAFYELLDTDKQAREELEWFEGEIKIKSPTNLGLNLDAATLQQLETHIQTELLIEELAISSLNISPEITNDLDGFNSNKSKTDKAGYFFNKNVRFIFITIIGLFIISIIWWFNQPCMTEINLTSKYNYTITTTQKSMDTISSSTALDNYKEGIDMYKEGLFDTPSIFQDVIKIFEKIQYGDSLYWRSQSYIGHCYFNLGNFEKANDQFTFLSQNTENILTEDSKEFKEEINWYLGLSYLGINNFTKGQNIIEAVAKKTDSSYQSRAKGLVSQLSDKSCRIVIK